MSGKIKAWIRRRKKFLIVSAIAGGSILSYSFVEDYYFEVGKNLDIYTTLFRDVNIYYVDSIQPPFFASTLIMIRKNAINCNSAFFIFPRISYDKRLRINTF